MAVSLRALFGDLSFDRLRRAVARRPQHCARANLRREFSDVHRHAGRVCARRFPRGDRAGNRGLRRSVRGFALLSGGRIFSELCDGEIAQIYFCAHGYPPGLRECAPGRRCGDGRPRGSGGGRGHRRLSGGENSAGRRGAEGNIHAGYQGADGRISAAGGRGRG